MNRQSKHSSSRWPLRCSPLQRRPARRKFRARSLNQPRSPSRGAGAGRDRAPDGKKPDPFAFADFTWLTGNPRTKESPLDTKVFTGEFRADTNFTYSFNQPQDDTIVGSSEIFRSARSRSRSSASAATFITTTCRAV